MNDTAEILTSSIFVDWILAGITFLAVLVAIFQEHIKRFFWKPKLVLELREEPPDCHKITINKYNKSGLIQASASSYYFRIRIKNSGTINAERVEIQASRLSKFNGEKFLLINHFTPMNLVFSHTHERYLESLSPKMEKLCDLFHVINPSEHQAFIPFESKKPIIWFDLEVNPNNFGNLIYDPGLYKLDIVVGASNIRKPISRSLIIKFNGNWNDDESEMIGKDLSIRLSD